MARSLRGKMPVSEELESSSLDGSPRYSDNKRPISIQLFINVGTNTLDSGDSALNIP